MENLITEIEKRVQDQASAWLQLQKLISQYRFAVEGTKRLHGQIVGLAATLSLALPEFTSGLPSSITSTEEVQIEVLGTTEEEENDAAESGDSEQENRPFTLRETEYKALLDYLEGQREAVTPSQVAEALGVKPNRAHKMLHRLNRLGTVQRVGTGMYRLPRGHSEALGEIIMKIITQNGGQMRCSDLQNHPEVTKRGHTVQYVRSSIHRLKQQKRLFSTGYTRNTVYYI